MKKLSVFILLSLLSLSAFSQSSAVFTRGVKIKGGFWIVDTNVCFVKAASSDTICLTLRNDSLIMNPLRPTNFSGSGSVTNVTASSPLLSSGGTTPNILADTTNRDASLATNYKIRTNDSVGTIVSGVWHGTPIDTAYDNGVSRITAGSNITLTQEGKTVNITSGTSIDSTTASNLSGTGIGIYKNEVNNDLKFKRIYSDNSLIVFRDKTDSVEAHVTFPVQDANDRITSNIESYYPNSSLYPSITGVVDYVISKAPKYAIINFHQTTTDPPIVTVISSNVDGFDLSTSGYTTVGSYEINFIDPYFNTYPFSAVFVENVFSDNLLSSFGTGYVSSFIIKPIAGSTLYIKTFASEYLVPIDNTDVDIKIRIDFN